MVLILVVMALVAVYSNVQKARRGKIETVTITPVASATPSSTPAMP